jgi:hypothetical protein
MGIMYEIKEAAKSFCNVFALSAQRVVYGVVHLNCLKLPMPRIASKVDTGQRLHAASDRIAGVLAACQ